MTSTTPSCTIPRTGLKGMETNWPRNWRLTVLKTIKMSLIRSLMTNFKTTIRADCYFACGSLPPPVCKSSCLLVVSEGNQPLDRRPSSLLPLRLWASKIKHIFLSISLVSLLAFWAVSSQTWVNTFKLKICLVNKWLLSLILPSE